MTSFSDYFVDLDAELAEQMILARLAKTGMFTFLAPVENARQKLLNVCRMLGHVHHHPDSEADGVTIIAPKDDIALRPGLYGFSRGTLDLHTDCSSIANPPDLIFNYCCQAAAQGGETLLVDTKAVFVTLWRERPGIMRKLMAPSSVIFGPNSEAYIGAIFEQQDDKGIRCRYRADGAGFTDIRIIDAIHILQKYLNRFCIRMKLESGQGYAVNNGWWLHGRTAFHGARKFMRIFVHSRPGALSAQWTRAGFKIYDYDSKSPAVEGRG